MFQKNRQTTLIKILIVILLISFTLAAFNSLKTETSITDTAWQWIRLIETNPASQSIVPFPENYTLHLGSDGSLTIKADCNRVGGAYELDANSLNIITDPSTMAFCSEQSLDFQFLELISTVESYSIENDQLVLVLKNDAGKMLFR